MVRGLTAGLCLLTLLGLTPTAHADDEAAAREHYRKGSSFFDVGRFSEAAHEYEVAYQFKNDPALLFNLGQAYRFSNEYEKAIIAYKSFLRRVPRASNAAIVQTHIANLQELIEKQKRAGTSAPSGTMAPESAVEPTPPPPAAAPATTTATEPAKTTASTTASSAPDRPKPLYKKWWLWTVVGGVVVVGLGVGLGVALTHPRTSGSNLPSVAF